MSSQNIKKVLLVDLRLEESDLGPNPVPSTHIEEDGSKPKYRERSASRSPA